MLEASAAQSDRQLREGRWRSSRSGAQTDFLALFELTTDGALTRVPATNFAAEMVLERADLQRALRSHIEVLDSNLFVVAEEFGDFAEVRRRIDLLCVDREGQVVVVELERTEDGGHMELQALRYAAMVSTMTFDQLVSAHERHLRQVEPDRTGEARQRLADFLDDVGGEDTVLERRVRILLVSGGFDPQITTTVLWLNDIYGLDITCIRLTPYRVDGRLILDVQQVIPLPEAEGMMVRLRLRESAARAATGSSGADWTPYIIKTPAGTSGPLRKRRAVLALVHALHQAGVRAADMEKVIPGPRFLRVDGSLAGVELAAAFVEKYPQAEGNERRWFLDEPIHESEQTGVLSKMWGLNTVSALDGLLTLAPSAGFGYAAVT